MADTSTGNIPPTKAEGPAHSTTSNGGISSSSGSIIASPFCGIGKRYRRLDCLDMSNQLAESM